MAGWKQDSTFTYTVGGGILEALEGDPLTASLCRQALYHWEGGSREPRSPLIAGGYVRVKSLPP